jgi:V8-like Glu-specific endopeptidase
MLSWKNSAKNGREEIGTAFLVHSRLILTALHNALDNFNNLHENMQFYPKRNCAMNSNHTTSEFAMVIAMRKAVSSSYKTNENPAEDFCLLLLDKPIKREQYIKLGFDYSLTENLNAEIFGYPREMMTEANEFSQFGTKGRIDSI